MSDGGSEVQPGSSLIASGLAKTFNGKRVLHPFEFTVQPGEVHALLGQNGSGKSTLIKILAGFHLPDPGGRCIVSGRDLEFGSPQSAHQLGLRFVHQDLGLIGSSTIADNLAFTTGFVTRFGTIRRRGELDRARAALGAIGLDLDPTALVASLSPAQRTGVAIARAVDFGGDAASVLVLDEPTASLESEEVEHLHSTLRQAASNGVGIVYVTHHLDEVFHLADRVSVLRDGYLVMSRPVADVSRREVVHELVGSELDAVQRTRRSSGPEDRSAPVLRVDALRADFVNGVTFEARPGEILGIYGLTGSGRESILGAMFGAVHRYGGDVSVDGVSLPESVPRTAIAMGVGYLPPDRKSTGGFMSMTATENLTIVDLSPYFRGGFLRSRAEFKDAGRWFARLQIRPRDGTALPMTSFSGGNQQKVVLGKWLRTASKVLLLDDPTQGVDVGAKAELHRQIIAACEDGLAVVVSSTDVEELASLCDRVLIMRNGAVAVELSGSSVSQTEINRHFQGVSEMTSGDSQR